MGSPVSLVVMDLLKVKLSLSVGRGLELWLCPWQSFGLEARGQLLRVMSSNCCDLGDFACSLFFREREVSYCNPKWPRSRYR